jgi:hypothetical protein
MRGNEWYDDRLLAGEREIPGIPIQYSVNFPWGDWYVSKYAHETLDIVPLAPVKDGYVQQQWVREKDVPIRVFLVAPGELGTHELSPNHTQIIVGNSPHSTEFRVAVGNTPESIVEQVIDEAINTAHEAHGEFADDDLRDALTDSEGLPYQEVVEHHAPQLLVHQLSRSLLSAIPDELFTAGNIARHHRMYKFIRQMSSSVLAGAGVSLAIGAIEHNQLASMSGIAAVSVAGVYLIAKLRRIMILESNNTHMYLASAHKESLAIVRDIHDIYCRDHFNREHSYLTET